MDVVSWLVTIAGLVGIVVWIYRRAVRREASRCPEGSGLYPECLYVVTVSSEDILVRRPDGSGACVRLTDLTRVSIETNDSGPGGIDVWWHWYGRSSEAVCSYPQGATGEPAALELVQSLQNFDDNALRRAMGCTSNRVFVIYEAA